MPGQPSGKVENSRCRQDPLTEDTESDTGFESLKYGVGLPLFRGGIAGCYSLMIPRFSPMVTAWVRSLALSLERMFLTWPFTVSSVMES